MKAPEIFMLVSEIFIPVLLALLTRNNTVTNNAYKELKELKRDISDDKLLQNEWKLEVTKLLNHNDRVVERNAQLIEQLVNNSYTGNDKHEA
ncbi:MAG: hypothetical protein WBA07_33635 [Rivularia sp. (in: cyanobacteria)]